jgi:CubicO group peptidase (beta-lactamase class C family)
MRLACLALLAAPFPALAEPRIAAVDDAVADVIGTETPGLAVLVTREGQVIHMAGYGLADIDSETPVTPDSIFDLASVSKQMTAMAAHLQMIDGLHTPETAVGDLLPAFADDLNADRPIVVLDLIHHLSGLTDYLSGDLDYGADTTNADVVDWLAAAERDADPGTQFSYSNSGYLTLGTLVAVAEGAPSLADVLETRLWGPLGMTDTNLILPVDEAAAVTGYDGTEGRFTEVSDPNISEGDGNVFSSIADLAKYEAWLDENGMLPDFRPVFRNGSTDDGTPIDDDGAGYGYGWFLAEMDGADYAYHSGSWTGTSTYYQRNLTTGISVILLANGESSDLDALALDVEAAADSAAAFHFASFSSFSSMMASRAMTCSCWSTSNFFMSASATSCIELTIRPTSRFITAKDVAKMNGMKNSHA